MTFLLFVAATTCGRTAGLLVYDDIEGNGVSLDVDRASRSVVRGVHNCDVGVLKIRSLSPGRNSGLAVQDAWWLAAALRRLRLHLESVLQALDVD